MADFLVKTLIECKQHIPDFFKELVPEEANVDFEDDSGADDDDDDAFGAAENGNGDAWGSAGGDAPAAEFAAPVVDAGWDSAAAGTSAGGAW